ncbi:MAG: lipid-A-disaccharide synthase [Bacteroidetes bacterium]|nr:lipid-A-disaccharide synthase [Bacteroidota bacterium]MBU1114831.1 lipid-A-disaccharide synthase [Bacteroidota bacterium]MBU1799978.1 lipid-A-disaccharide synthase [Bacteroidota bacterium]
MNNFNKKILILAGEASGDLHASSLVTALLNSKNELKFSGIAGDNMISSGVEALYHIKEMSFLGFVEVIKHLPFILKVEKAIIEYVKLNKIKFAILVDYPGFNLRIAKKLKVLGVKIVYYISPQIWAWHQSRIKKIKKRVNKMLVVFPFEKDFYEDGGVQVEYVGHPLVERIENFEFKSKDNLLSELGIKKDIFLILPGSRKHEIEEHLSELIKTAKIISDNNNLQTVVACSENLDVEYLQKFISDNNVKIVKGNTYNLLKNSKFGIIKSGTSTLEATIIGLPFVVIYSTNKLTYELGKRLVKINYIAMPNIIAGKSVVKEFIQNDVNATLISDFIQSLLDDNSAIRNLKNELEIIKNKLGKSGASNNAAKIIEAMLNED